MKILIAAKTPPAKPPVRGQTRKSRAHRKPQAPVKIVIYCDPIETLTPEAWPEGNR